MSDTVTLARAGDVAIITLNRPDAANAIDLELAAALRAVAERLKQEDWARAIVLQAEGKLFCGGGDVASMVAQRKVQDDAGYAAFFDSLVKGFHNAVLALLDLDAPLIAAVDGTAAGGGMSLVLACDIVLASPRAKFVPAYPGIGLSCDGGMSWSLPRIVGPKRAAQLLLANKPMPADEAERLGIVSEVLEQDGFTDAVLARAEAVAKGPRRAIGQLRRLIRESAVHTLTEQLDAERAAIVPLSLATDAQEGLAALGERRAAKFTD